MPTQREFRPLLPEPDPSTVPGQTIVTSTIVLVDEDGNETPWASED